MTDNILSHILLRHQQNIGSTYIAKGKIKEITSLSNPIIKSLKALHLKKNRTEDKLFLCEGLKLIIHALDLGWPIKYLVISKNKISDPLCEQLISKTLVLGGDVLIVREKILENLTKRENCQHAVGVFPCLFAQKEDLTLANENVFLALDRVRDPGNLGTIIRTADAVGIQTIILIGDCTDAYALEAVRATMGSIFAMPLLKMSEEHFIKFIKTHGIFTIGTHLQGALDYRKINYHQKNLCLIMGNEQKGLTNSLASSCDQLARIPQIGQADSLNLAIATGLMLFEAKRHIL